MLITQPHIVVIAVLVAVILLGLAGRLLGLVRPEQQEWRTAIDLPMGVASGLGGAWLMAFWTAPRLVSGYPVWASSFLQYCTVVACQAHHGYFACMPSYGPRSPAAGWPASLLARQLGTIEAMTWYSLLSMVLLCFGLFMWARLVHGRTAGVAAALLASCVPALVWLVRDLSFLPVKNACWVLMAACVAALFRAEKSWKPVLITGLVCGLSFQVNPRGIVIGLALLGAAMAATALRAGSLRRGLNRLALLLAPVVISWFAASYTLVPVGGSVSQVYYASIDGAEMVDLGAEFVERYDEEIKRLGYPADDPLNFGANRPPDFRWGSSNPGHVVSAFRQLLAISRALPAEMIEHPEFVRARRDKILVWVPGLVLALFVGLLGLRKRPWQVLALLATSLPFVALAWGAVKVLPMVRFFTYSAVLVPFVLGVGIGAALEPARPASEQAGWRRLPLGSLVALVVLTVSILVAGAPFLKSTSMPLADSSPKEDIQDIYAGRILSTDVCHTLLLEELHQGFDIQPRLYGSKGLIVRDPQGH